MQRKWAKAWEARIVPPLSLSVVGAAELAARKVSVSMPEPDW